MGWDVALWMIIASYVIAYATAPKQQGTPPAAMDEVEFPQAAEGTPQCVIFGDVWCPDWTILAIGDYSTHGFK